MRAIALLGFLLIPLLCNTEEGMAIPHYERSLVWEDDADNLLKRTYDDLTRVLRPVAGPISSGFGSRMHPIFGVRRHHRGIDIACAFGSEVRAVLPGVVTAAGREGGYGKIVRLHHVGRISETRYAHLSRTLVSPGQKVNKGQLIGFSGESGVVTGPHLHFEMAMRGRQVDPERYLPRATASAVSSQKSSTLDPGLLRLSSSSY